jgi:hypothetical protein
MNAIYSTGGNMRIQCAVHLVLVEKPQEKRTSVRLKPKREDTIETGLRNVGFQRVG